MNPTLARRGFTLIEMLITVCVIGILAAFAVPRARDARLRAEAAALVERVHAIRIAYEAAGEPPTAALIGPAGKVPPVLARHLADGFFIGELGVRLKLAGVSAPTTRGVAAWSGIVLIASTPEQKRMLQIVHAQSSEPMLALATTTMFALNDEGRTFIENANSRTTARRP